MPGRTTLVLALILVLVGGVLRFYHYHVLEQYLLKLVIAISVAIFACSVVLSILKTRPQTYRDSIVYAIVVAILWGFTYESAASNRLKNQKYVERLSGIINRYVEKNHATPNSFDEALAASGETLPNRGDADGGPYLYLRMSDRIYILRIFGPNRQNDFGSGDDIQVNYLNGNSVSFEQLSNWIETMGSPEEREKLEAYRSVLQRS
jgi:hypothetical protein